MSLTSEGIPNKSRKQIQGTWALIKKKPCRKYWILKNRKERERLRQGRIQTVASVAHATLRFFKDNFFQSVPCRMNFQF